MFRMALVDVQNKETNNSAQYHFLIPFRLFHWPRQIPNQKWLIKTVGIKRKVQHSPYQLTAKPS